MVTRNQYHIDKFLTDYGIGYSQNIAGRFIASQIGFTKKVEAASDKYPIWTKGDWFRSEMTVVGRHEPSPEANVAMSDSSFFCDEYRLKTFLNTKDEKEAEVNLRQAKTKYLVEQALLKRDIVVATEVFATGKWTSNTEQTGVSGSPSTNEFKQWNDAASTPITDCNTAREAVRQGCGHEANTMIIGPIVKNKLLEHADVLDLYKYTAGGVPSLDQLRQALRMDRLIVGNAVQNTAREGATAVQADVFGKAALFLYVPEGMDEYTPKPVTNFSWSPYDQVEDTSASIRTWRNEDPQGEYFEVEQAFDCAITANDAGVFYTSAVA